MESKETKPSDETTKQGDSLEGGSTSSLETAQDNSLENATSTTGKIEDAGLPVAASGSFAQRLVKKVNVYLLLFILLLAVAGAIVLITFLASKKQSASSVETQSLSSSTLKQLATSDVTVGQPRQILRVQGNAIFAGKVLINDSLEVAGPIKVGGSLSVPGITVSGNSLFEQLQISKNLAVAGDTSMQGQLAVQKGLSVAGSGTFGGTLTAPALNVSTLQLSGTLTITKHIAVGGPTPGRDNGPALGGGGTVAVSGSDTAGSVNINTGGSPAVGCFVTVNFTQKYNSTPRVQVTPVGAAAGQVGYYITRSSSGFSICAANTPSANASFGFDYFVVE